MQNKTEAPKSKSGQHTVAPSWFPDLSTMPVFSPPMEMMKQRMQAAKTGDTPVRPSWLPDFSSMPSLPGPMTIVKQRMQAAKTSDGSGNTPWFSSLFTMPVVTTPMDVAKQKLKAPKAQHQPVTTPWFPSFSTMPWLSAPIEMVKQKAQATKTGSKPASTPWFPDFSSALWFSTPMDAVQQRLAQGHTPSGATPDGSVPPTPPKKPSYPAWMPSTEQMHQQAWNGSNFAVVALLTSLSIVSVQSPIKTMLVNLTKNGCAIPVYQGGIFGFARAMYAGTSASISGSVIRTGYVTGAKGGSRPVEEGIMKDEAREDGKKYAASYGYVMAMALGDVLVTQIPESLSTLKKIPNFLPKGFTWKTAVNAKELMLGGFGPRYASGMVNFGALCVLEERIAQGLPIQNHNAAHFTAGMLSGMAAAVVSYPFTAFKDYTLVKSTITPEGNLKSASSLKLTQELFYAFMSSPQASAKAFGEMFLKQAPLRMGLTGVIFALVAGVGEVVGPEPLTRVVSEDYRPTSVGKSRHGMFAQPQTPRIEEIDETDEHTQTPTSNGPTGSK